MTSDMQGFWDDVHRTRWVPSLGETTFDEYVEYLSGAGPFREELADAQAVLDVGPGFGKFLAGCQELGKRCFAVEISAENRTTLGLRGVLSWAPGEFARSNAAINMDVATCISVMQHCNEAMVLTLLRDVYAALRSDGVFYANGIINHQMRTQTDAENTRGGSHSYTLHDIQRMATAAGLVLAGSKQYPHPDFNIDVWIARMVKP